MKVSDMNIGALFTIVNGDIYRKLHNGLYQNCIEFGGTWSADDLGGEMFLNTKVISFRDIPFLEVGTLTDGTPIKINDSVWIHGKSYFGDGIIETIEPHDGHKYRVLPNPVEYLVQVRFPDGTAVKVVTNRIVKNN
jgi:hypothetical protein